MCRLCCCRFIVGWYYQCVWGGGGGVWSCCCDLVIHVLSRLATWKEGAGCLTFFYVFAVVRVSEFVSSVSLCAEPEGGGGRGADPSPEKSQNYRVS